MNEQQLQKSERIASKVMRILAIIGLVSILALVAWVFVQGFKVFPNMGDAISAAVSSVTSVFRNTPDESLVLEVQKRTVLSGDTTEVRFVYTGTKTPANYMFSYECAEGVSLSVQTESVRRDLTCATPLSFTEPTARVQFNSTQERLKDVELTVTAGALKDSTLVTVVGSTGTSTTGTSTSKTAPTTPKNTQTKATTSASSKPSTGTVVSQKPVVKPVTPSKPVDIPKKINTPADLSLNILETGILTRVNGKSTFFPVEPIPSNKTAAVTFTVTNMGDTPSGTWAFKAWLPIEGDSDYRYTSPLQTSLKPGMQVEYTLGFDEVARAKTGVIKVEIVPTDKKDATKNNVDAVKIAIKKV